jgi:RNA polymerase sigma factor (sigma-70 family)
LRWIARGVNKKTFSYLNGNSPTDLTDTELLAKLRDPNTHNYGFNLLVRAYQQRVYGLVRKMVIDHDDAHDVTQEVFIKIHKSIQSFREDSQLFTWIYRIASNECFTFLSKKRRRFLLPIEDVAKELSSLIDSSDSIGGDEIQKKLQKAILTLPDKQRLVFNMKYFDDLSYDEMEAITGTSTGALKASYHHAVKKIEDYLAKD